MIDDSAIEQAAKRLWDAAPAVTRLVIFGFCGWGQGSAHSDLDLLVIEPDPPQDPAAEAVRLRRALRGMLIAVNIVAVSAQSAREWRDVPNSLVGAALAEGWELSH